MEYKSCRRCTNEQDVCFHCGCTVCGMKMRSPSLSVVSCAVCGSQTHMSCRRDPFTAEVVVEPPDLKKRKLEERRFYHCSVDCALGVSLTLNTLCNAALSAWLEAEIQSRWELGWRMREPAGSSLLAPVFPFHSCPSEEEREDCWAAFLQLRFEGWLHYFDQERLMHAHPSFLIPPFLHFHNAAVASALHELMSPAGQARRLFGLDPRTHRIGSLLALPNTKRWKDLAVSIASGKSNGFVHEAQKWIQTRTIKPTLVNDVNLLLGTKASGHVLSEDEVENPKD